MVHVPRGGQALLRYVKELAPGILRFGLELDCPLQFRGGQFLALEPPGISGYRNYSIVNYEETTRDIDLVMKTVPGGAFSEWITQTPAGSRRIKWFGPLGMATFDPGIEEDLICIAGGTGIAGMMAILAHAQCTNYFNRHFGHVFFGVRRFSDSFFLDELCALAEKALGRLKITVAFSDPDSTTPPPERFRGLTFERGLVHEVAARGVGKGRNAIGYVAGPSAAVDAAVRMLVLQAGLPPKNIRYDRFS